MSANSPVTADGKADPHWMFDVQCFSRHPVRHSLCDGGSFRATADSAFVSALPLASLAFAPSRLKSPLEN